MIDDVSIEKCLSLRRNSDVTLIDVRSPQEYADGTIPGSINIPIFDDEERKEVGTIYKQVGVEEAKLKGLEIVSRKLPAFIAQFAKIPGPKVVFCWRGGMRSKTAATLVSLMGIRARRLIGGIRAYRRWVVHALEQFELKAVPIVLNGYTGTGKTKILEMLQNEGYPVLNLEQLAQHRGSIFGHIGLEPHNQKTFESLLVEHLMQLNDSPYFLVEGESRRIGKALLPDFLLEAKQQGYSIIIEMPLQERVHNILQDYNPDIHKEQCLTAFSLIKKHIHTPIAREIEDALQADRFHEGVSLLLEHYYDKRYDHSMQQASLGQMAIHAANTEDAAVQIKRIIRELGWKK